MVGFCKFLSKRRAPAQFMERLQNVIGRRLVHGVRGVEDVRTVKGISKNSVQKGWGECLKRGL